MLASVKRRGKPFGFGLASARAAGTFCFGVKIGYRFYRGKWIELCFLTCGIGIFVWASATGEVKLEPAVVPLVIGGTVVGHVLLLSLMFRAKHKEDDERRSLESGLHRGDDSMPGVKLGGLWNQEIGIRGIGFLTLAAGLVLSLLSAVLPIHQAATHQSSVSLSLKGAFISPTVIGLGLLYSIFPEWTTRFAGHPSHPTGRALVIYVPLLVMGAALYYWVKHVVESYGFIIR